MGNPAAPRRTYRRPPSSGSGVPIVSIVLAVVAVAAGLKYLNEHPSPASPPPPQSPPAPSSVGLVRTEPAPSAPPPASPLPQSLPAPPPATSDPRPAPDDDGIAGTWETDDGAFIVSIRRDGQFDVAAAVFAGDEIRFASGKCERAAGEASLWRGEIIAIDDAGVSRLADVASRAYAADAVNGHPTSRARAVLLGAMAAFAAKKEDSSDPPGFFRQNGVLFNRLGRFKVSMIGPSSRGGTTGLAWSLRRVD